MTSNTIVLSSSWQRQLQPAVCATLSSAESAEEARFTYCNSHNLLLTHRAPAEHQEPFRSSRRAVDDSDS